MAGQGPRQRQVRLFVGEIEGMGEGGMGLGREGESACVRKGKDDVCIY